MSAVAGQLDLHRGLFALVPVKESGERLPRALAVVATGNMYDVDRVGEGRVRIVALPDGSRVLRLEDSFVSINSDLEIWFREHPHLSRYSSIVIWCELTSNAYAAATLQG